MARVPKLSNDLMAGFQTVIDSYAEMIVAEVYVRWGEWAGDPRISGNAHMYDPEVRRTAKDTIICLLTADGQRAFEMEYGKGSLSTVDNPALLEYQYWHFFNSARSGKNMAILSREKGEMYLDLDGNVHYSKAPNVGYNLEWTNKEKYQPFPALHTIRELICGVEGNGGMLPLILEDLAMVMVEYDFFAKLPNKIML